MKVFKVNEYITLKLEAGKTNIYVKNQRFYQCKFLLLNIPIEKISSFDEIESIDEAERLNFQVLGRQTISIPSDVEFWGHCSNLQVWAENNYNTRLLHRNIAFPLLKRLTEVGDPLAIKVFREEIVKRFLSGTPKVKHFLSLGYLDYLNTEEKNTLFKEISLNLKENIFKPISRNDWEDFYYSFNTLSKLIKLKVKSAKTLMIESIETLIKNEDIEKINIVINEGWSSSLGKKELVILESLLLKALVNFPNTLEKFNYILHDIIEDCFIFKLQEGIENDFSLWELKIKPIIEKFSNKDKDIFLSYLIVRNLLKRVPNEELLDLFKDFNADNVADKLLLIIQKNNDIWFDDNLLLGFQEKSVQIIFRLLEDDNYIEYPEAFIKDIKKIKNINYGFLIQEIEKCFSRLGDQDLKYRLYYYIRALLPLLHEDDAYSFVKKKLLNSIFNLHRFEQSDHLRLIDKLTPENNIKALILDWLNSEESNAIKNLQSLINKEFKIMNLEEGELCEPPFFFIGKNKNISMLNLFDCKIKTFPLSITKFLNLKRLNLTKNQLEKIPDSIGELKKLKILYAGWNNLKEIPDSIGDLNALEKLDFNFNKLITLPNTIGNLIGLKRMYIFGNPFKALPNSLINLVNTEFYIKREHLQLLSKDKKLRFLCEPYFWTHEAEIYHLF